jgi:hypothetical protein
MQTYLELWPIRDPPPCWANRCRIFINCGAWDTQRGKDDQGAVRCISSRQAPTLHRPAYLGRNTGHVLAASARAYVSQSRPRLAQQLPRIRGKIFRKQPTSGANSPGPAQDSQASDQKGRWVPGGLFHVRTIVRRTDARSPSESASFPSLIWHFFRVVSWGALTREKGDRDEEDSARRHCRSCTRGQCARSCC